ncbi:calcium-binding protein [Marinivivus vitaminiproducens]|uniref:calcium-binding protein n=1 Tax=Marinivivus vitaminiproducens TaxID=3035935 RepID=UPI0027AB7DDF|nr:calcium-binding protein [Geminicoccaceae bacterium SCSIO 64248]
MAISETLLNLLGVELSNAVYGGPGDDAIEGTDANDYIEGRAGADTLAGGDGMDTIGYSESQQSVTVDLNSQLLDGGILGGADVSGGDAEGDNGGELLGIPLMGPTGFENVVGSASGDTLIGNDDANILLGLDGNDVLTGGAGDDQLMGLEGDDTIRGGLGRDRMDGGAGADTFVFETIPELNGDAIDNLTFSEGDRIDLSAIDADVSTPEDDAFRLVAGGPPGSSHEVGVLSYYFYPGSGLPGPQTLFLTASNGSDAASRLDTYVENADISADSFIL